LNYLTTKLGRFHPFYRPRRPLGRVEVVVDVDWFRGFGALRLRSTWAVSRRPSVHRVYFPPSSPEALHVKLCESPLLVKGGIMGEKWPIKFSLTITTSTKIVRDFLHAANLRHGTNGFTSRPKEGMLRIISSAKSDGFGRV
jgi:hypothetical protein